MFPAELFARPGATVSPTTYNMYLTSYQQSLPSLRVENSGEEAANMSIEVGGLGQNIDGSAIIISDPAVVQELSSYFNINPTQFSLAKGQKTYVPISVNIPPSKQGGVYAVLSVTASKKKASAGPGQYQTISKARIGVLMELGLPGGVMDGKIAGMVIEQVPSDRAFTTQEQTLLDQKKKIPGYRYNLQPVIENIGNTHYTISRGYTRVLTQDNEEIGRPEISSATVLPGYKRKFNCVWRLNRPLPDGKYYAEAHAWVPSKPEKELVYGEWFLVENGMLARRAGRIESISPLVTSPNKAFPLRVQCKNTGNIPYQPTLEVEISKDKKIVVPKSDISMNTVTFDGGTQKWFSSAKKVKGLPLGTYKVRVKMTYQRSKYNPIFQDQNLDEKEFEILVREQEPWWKVFWNWLLKHWWWFAIAIGVLVIAYVIYWQNRKHKEQMERMRRQPRMMMRR